MDIFIAVTYRFYHCQLFLTWLHMIAWYWYHFNHTSLAFLIVNDSICSYANFQIDPLVSPKQARKCQTSIVTELLASKAMLCTKAYVFWLVALISSSHLAILKALNLFLWNVDTVILSAVKPCLTASRTATVSIRFLSHLLRGDNALRTWATIRLVVQYSIATLLQKSLAFLYHCIPYSISDSSALLNIWSKLFHTFFSIYLDNFFIMNTVTILKLLTVNKIIYFSVHKLDNTFLTSSNS